MKLKSICQPISYEQGYVLRGIAMLMIMFAHSINEYDTYNSDVSVALLVPKYGMLGCSVFFFMSGYGLLCSLSKQKRVSIGYLWQHVWKMLVPFLIAYAGTVLVVESLLPNIHADILSILSLTMPEGTDMWFFKVILCNYVIATILFMLKLPVNVRIAVLFGIHCVAIVVMYLLGAPGYCYFSNLCFPLGMWFAYVKTKPVKEVQWLLYACIVFLCVYYVFITIHHTNAPLEILLNVVFGLLAALLVVKVKLRHHTWLVFIGKNSLCFYLFNVPIMLALPASAMHWITYFALNLLLTWIATIVYLPLNNRIFGKTKSKIATHGRTGLKRAQQTGISAKPYGGASVEPNDDTDVRMRTLAQCAHRAEEE